MVSTTNLRGLYVALPAYFSLMVAAAVASVVASRRRHKKAEGEDALSSHFIAGRSLGVVITVATLFASLFSGYTVVGIPNEAYRNGFSALRWIPGTLFIVWGYMLTGPRLRRASVVRNHQAPSDFVTDRFRSQCLRYVVVVLQAFPACIYLAAQMSAIHSTFNSMFNIDVDNPTAVILIGITIVVLEWAGGLNSVAWTDALQGILMVFGFVLLGSVLSEEHGGWRSLDPTTYPRPQMYQVPSSETQLDMWCFMTTTFGFFTLPHLMQRTYAASSMRALKCGYAVMALGPWFCQLIGIVAGGVGVEALRDAYADVGAEPSSPFTAIVESLMDASGFGYFAGLLILTASLAAIMSTADSLLIAISQLATTELFYPLWPRATPRQVTHVAHGASLVAMVAATAIALYADGLAQLQSIQFGMSLQSVPIFLVGLYAPSEAASPHPWPLAAGGLVGLVTALAVQYATPDDAFKLNPGIAGLLANLGTATLLEAALRLRHRLALGAWCGPVVQPGWDAPSTGRFGEAPLDAALLRRIMAGSYEPALQGWFVPFAMMLSLAVLPLSSAGEPSLGPELDGARPEFAPALVGGVPDWAFKLLLFSAVFTAQIFSGIHRISSSLDDSVGDGDDAAQRLALPYLTTRSEYDDPPSIRRSRLSTGQWNLEQAAGPRGSTRGQESLRGSTRAPAEVAVAMTALKESTSRISSEPSL